MCEHLRAFLCFSVWAARTVNGIVRLTAHPWPGNVRELQAVIQRAVLTVRGYIISAGDLDLDGSVLAAAHLTLKAARNAAVAQCERSYLSNVLARCQGNITQAARMAGKERRCFQRLLRKHEIAVPPFRNSPEAA